MSNSKNIKPVILAIVKLRISQSVSQSVNQSVSQSVNQSVSQSVSQKKISLNNLFQNSIATFKSISGQSESLSGLVLPNQYCPIIIYIQIL